MNIGNFVRKSVWKLGMNKDWSDVFLRRLFNPKREEFNANFKRKVLTGIADQRKFLIYNKGCPVTRATLV